MNIFSFDEFLYEFNNADEQLIKSLDDYFTVAIEYELCLNENPEDEPPIENYENSAKYAKEIVLLAVKRRMSYGFKFDMSLDEISEFIDGILEEVIEAYYEEEEDDLYDDLLDPNNYDTDTQQFIIDELSGSVMRFFDSQNMDYLKKRLKQALPNFYKKYAKTFKYELEGDDEKQRILEFSPKTYLNGVTATVQQINDFYDEFEKQDIWYFNNRTALHINVGIKKGKLNPLKGLIILSDFNRSEKVPYVFKGIENRISNVNVGSMLDKLKSLLKDEINKKEQKNKRNWKNLNKYKKHISTNIDKLDLHNMTELEDFMNDLLLKTNIDFWVKEFGLNITQYKSNYTEFRFIGGDAKRDLVLDKLYYYAYITYAMSNPEYKRKQYIKGLYKLTEEIKDIIKKP